MTPHWLTLALVVSATLSAVLGGVFLAFSDLVMRSLAKAQGSGGAEAMQIINREVMGTLFGALLWVMLAASLAFTARAVFPGPSRARALLVAGGLAYIVGVGVVTGVANVPMNLRLDGLRLGAPATVAYFTEQYVPTWTRWNHVRTAACLITAMCYLSAGVLLARAGERVAP
jgi:uncharacterized membrane protein